MYVQLDKCLKQFQRGCNAETEDHQPDALQLWLSMIADVNDESVSKAAEENEELQSIRSEALVMAQDREVQNIIIQERYDRMDWLTYGNQREAAGENNFATLINKLFAAGRGDEVQRAANDKEYRAKLFKEFQIN